MYSEFFLVFRLGCACIDTANTRDRGRDHHGGRADGEQGKAYGIVKSEYENDEDSHKENAGKQTAEKSVFAVCARGDISAEKCCDEKNDQSKDRCGSGGVVCGKSHKASDHKEQKSDGKGNACAEKDGNEKVFFFFWLRTAFNGWKFGHKKDTSESFC